VVILVNITAHVTRQRADATTAA